MQVHPADIAALLSNSPFEYFDSLFAQLSTDLQQKVFEHLSNSLQAQALRIVEDRQKLVFLEHMAMDDISDLVDFASDHELKHYFSLLHHKDRERVINLLKLKSSSVGQVVDYNVVSLHENFSVKRATEILQRLEPEQELHRTIYITNGQNYLVGQIWLEDLVLKAPHVILASFMRTNELILHADEDQEDAAKKMRHYELTSAPVVSQHNLFLGAVTDKTLVDILEEEAGEDILRISAVPGIKHTYLETPFFRVLFERGSLLFVLMLIESFSQDISEHYHELLTTGGLYAFITMLISTGGNTSTQSSGVVIQGIASGELHSANLRRFLRREFLIAFCLAFLLGITAFIRVFYLAGKPLVYAIALGSSISTIVILAIILGSSTPFILKRIGVDPAFAAAPFLATGMDLIGMFTFRKISQLILNFFT
jgi:magnesium transporter